MNKLQSDGILAADEEDLPGMQYLNRLLKKINEDECLLNALREDTEFNKFVNEHKGNLPKFVEDTIERLKMLAKLGSKAEKIYNNKKKPS